MYLDKYKFLFSVYLVRSFPNTTYSAFCSSRRYRGRTYAIEHQHLRQNYLCISYPVHDYYAFCKWVHTVQRKSEFVERSFSMGHSYVLPDSLGVLYNFLFTGFLKLLPNLPKKAIF